MPGMPKVQDALGYLDKVKCFARGTLVRLYDGEAIPVERVRPGTQLMGDDSGPRTVGELTQGTALMYTVTPALKTLTPFTVNGEHTLVLRLSPSVPAISYDAAQRRHSVVWYELGTDHSLHRHVQPQRSHTAAVARRAAVMAKHRCDAGGVWEVSVADFIRAPAAVQRQCSLMFSRPVTFVNPQLPRLHRVLSVILRAQPTAAQEDWAAWFLGLRVVSGDTDWDRLMLDAQSASPSQAARPEVIARLLSYQQLFGGGQGHEHQLASSTSITHQLLLSYGLVNNPHIPQACICDTLEVRHCILAGIIDGAGHYDVAHHRYHITAQHPRVLEGVKLLTSSLGLRNEAASLITRAHEETEEQRKAYLLTVTGDMCSVAQHVASPSKLCPQPGTEGYVAASDDNWCSPFSIALDCTADYFGFSVHGGANLRFLLADFTITHNVSRCYTHLALILRHHPTTLSDLLLLL